MEGTIIKQRLINVIDTLFSGHAEKFCVVKGGQSSSMEPDHIPSLVRRRVI